MSEYWWYCTLNLYNCRLLKLYRSRFNSQSSKYEPLAWAPDGFNVGHLRSPLSTVAKQKFGRNRLRSPQNCALAVHWCACHVMPSVGWIMTSLKNLLTSAFFQYNVLCFKDTDASLWFRIARFGRVFLYFSKLSAADIISRYISKKVPEFSKILKVSDSELCWRQLMMTTLQKH